MSDAKEQAPMGNTQAIHLIKSHLTDCAGLLAALDQAPAIIRNNPQASEARGVLEASVEITQELARRVRQDIKTSQIIEGEAEEIHDAEAVDNGNEK